MQNVKNIKIKMLYVKRKKHKFKMLYVERKKLKFFYNTKFTNECRDQFIGPVAVRRIIGNKIKNEKEKIKKKNLLEKF